MEFTPGKLKLVAALFVIVFCNAGLHIVSRIALNIDVSKLVFILYRNITALLLLGPSAYFLEKKDRPPLTFSLLVQFFFLGLIGHSKPITLYLRVVLYITNLCISYAKLSSCYYFCHGFCFKVPMMKNYPAKLSLTTFPCFFGVIQLLVVTAFTERDPRNWRIQSGREVLTILYVGIIYSGVVYSLVTWCIQKGGPVLTATFQPLQTVVVAVLAFLFLGDQLYSGVVFGGILIAAGVYLVLWGKTEEEKIANQDKEGATLRKHLLDQENTEECPVTVQV